MGLLDIFKRTKTAPPQEVRPLQVIAHGSTGIEIFSGYIQEEYLAELREDQAADVYDKMRRSDSQIKMVLSAIKNPIKKANWFIEAAGDTPTEKYMAEFVEHCLMNDLDKSWRKLLHECLSMIDFGYAPFEVTHKVVEGHPRFGTYVGFASLGWRSPRTIERFNVEKDGRLKSITQYAYGDLQRLVDIPAEFLYMFTLDAEGDNYAGISMLRACYGSWLRKQKYLKYMAIGIEKSAVPTPVGTVPDTKQGSAEFATFKEVLAAYVSHQTQFITKPKGWEIEFLDSKFEPEKVAAAIEVEDKAIVKAFLANFLELGLSGGGGSYALSFDQSDFFLNGIEHIADVIAEVFNNQIIPSLIKANFGEMRKYPQLTYSGISDKAGTEFATILNTLSAQKIITPDDRLEDHIRKKYDLPDADPESARVTPAPVPTPGQTPTVALSERIQMSEKKKPLKQSAAFDLIDKATPRIRSVMQEHLKRISAEMVRQLIYRFRNASPSQKLAAINNVTVKGQTLYRDALREIMEEYAVKATAQAARESRIDLRITGVKLSENYQFARTFMRLTALPKKTRDRIAYESALLVGSQIKDLEKVLFFAYANSAPDSDSAKIMEFELNGVADDYMGGPSVMAAAANSSARVINDARQAFFFEDEVLEQIESFTSVNPDPTAPICVELQNVTVSPDDPALVEYATPRHHNCKSTWVPNLKGDKNNPEITGVPSLTKKAQDSQSF